MCEWLGGEGWAWPELASHHLTHQSPRLLLLLRERERERERERNHVTVSNNDEDAVCTLSVNLMCMLNKYFCRGAGAEFE